MANSLAPISRKGHKPANRRRRRAAAGPPLVCKESMPLSQPSPTIYRYFQDPALAEDAKRLCRLAAGLPGQFDSVVFRGPNKEPAVILDDLRHLANRFGIIAPVPSTGDMPIWDKPLRFVSPYDPADVAESLLTSRLQRATHLHLQGNLNASDLSLALGITGRHIAALSLLEQPPL